MLAISSGSLIMLWKLFLCCITKEMTLNIWTVAWTSAFVDNIPMVAAFIPVIREYSMSAGIPANILWWSMALGAGFGANGTAIGSSANIISISIAEKNGYRVTFADS